jgi:hypothetical protein
VGSSNISRYEDDGLMQQLPREDDAGESWMNHALKIHEMYVTCWLEYLKKSKLQHQSTNKK